MATRKPSAYAEFVRDHYDSVRHIPSPQDRMKELGKMWQLHKQGKLKPKKKATRKKKATTKKAPRKRRRKKAVATTAGAVASGTGAAAALAGLQPRPEDE